MDALSLMNPREEELERGQQAARDLVAHMKRMGAAGTEYTFPDGNGEWTVTVEFKGKGKPV
jgi:hypothetical protein